MMAELMKELCYYEDRGICLYLEGQNCSSYQVVEACMLKEGIIYMRDYVEDEDGRLVQISFDRVICHMEQKKAAGQPETQTEVNTDGSKDRQQ